MPILNRPNPKDFFKFEFGIHCCTEENFADYEGMHLLQPPSINCKRFYGEYGYEYLRANLAMSPYPIPECLIDEIIFHIIYKVQEAYPIIDNDDGAADADADAADADDNDQVQNPLDSQVFYICMGIWILDDDEEDDDVDDVIEESMQQVRMISASKDAIESLKKVDLKVMKEIDGNQSCVICMDEFDFNKNGDGDGDGDGDSDCSIMPCNHVFHHNCILQWLQTSHTCPLCRYAMPTANT